MINHLNKFKALFTDLLKEVCLIFLDFFQWIVESTIGNILGIIAIISAIYFFFKSVKRLVYTIDSKNIISIDLKSIENFKFLYKDKIISSLYISDLIIYNNGQKSVNKDDISILKLKGINGEIFDYTELKKHNSTKYELINNTLTIKLDEFDSKEYLVLRVFHESNIKLEGRIKESGKLLNGESQLWTKINFIILILIFLSFFLSANYITENDITSWKWTVVTVIATIIVYFLKNFIHSMFFIPLRITRKFFKEKK